ncbi:MAG: lipopolysaccharide biosynthesis protein [Thiocapsa sp.]|nr:lipopolysaccharide biosynthesis protein [Thiocapsa sp.]QVL50311.1 MAG: lipopolysaccharide biosynthesis protein [Thiocapsa sp.]
MTTENLGRLIEEYDLYPDLRRDYGLRAAVAQMRTDVTREMITAQFADPRSGRATSATIAFSVSYDSGSASKAQEVAQAIADLYLSISLEERTRTARESTTFLEQESQRLGAEISALDATLARFKEEHGDRLPENMRLNLDFMQRTEDRIRTNVQEITALEEQVIYLVSELALMDPYAAVYTSTGERVMSPSDRLKSLEAEYLEIASRYSPAHPDRIRIEREMNKLRSIVGEPDNRRDLARRLGEQQSELSTLMERYSKDHPEVQRLTRETQLTRQQLLRSNSGRGSLEVSDADNPSYIQLQARLAAAESRLDSLRKTAAELATALKGYEERILSGPQVEREYQELARDRELLVATYSDINSKLNEAKLAETLEAESRGERLSLIDPPTVPTEPHSPDRVAIMFFGFVLSVGTGIGLLAFREATDERIYGARPIQTITGHMPLVLIPKMLTAQDIRSHRAKTTRIALILGLVAIASLLIVHYFFLPVDSLWSSLFPASVDP